MRPIRLIFAFYYFYPIKLLCRVLKAVLGHSDASCCVVFFISLSNQLLNFVFIRKINIIRIILYQFLKHLFAVSYPLFLLKRGRTCTKKFCLTEGHDAVQRTRIGIPLKCTSHLHSRYILWLWDCCNLIQDMTFFETPMHCLTCPLFVPSLKIIFSFFALPVLIYFLNLLALLKSTN